MYKEPKRTKKELLYLCKVHSVDTVGKAYRYLFFYGYMPPRLTKNKQGRWSAETFDLMFDGVKYHQIGLDIKFLHGVFGEIFEEMFPQLKLCVGKCIPLYNTNRGLVRRDKGNRK